MRLWSRPLIVAGIGVVSQGPEGVRPRCRWAAAGPGRASRSTTPSAARVWRSRGRAAAHRHTQRPGPTKQATRRQGLAGLREDTPSQSSAHPAPLVWRTPGAGRGAGGRRPGLAGLRDRPLRAKLACGDLAGGTPPTGTNTQADTQAQTLSHKHIGTTKPPGPTGGRAAHASGR